MLQPNTVKRIEEMVESHIVQFDVALKQDIAKINQNLISRGLFNSTVQIGETRVVAEANLDSRAKIIKQSIQEVCKAHGVIYGKSLPLELSQLFKRLFSVQLNKANAMYNSNIPVENRALCSIRDLNPNVSSYEREIHLWAEGLAETKTSRYDDLLTRIKNHKVICIILVMGAIVIALGTFTDSLNKIISLITTNHEATEPTPTVFVDANHIRFGGDYVSGDKVSHNTYITHVTNAAQSGNIASETTLLNFFYQYSSAFNAVLNKVPGQLIQDLPGFLQKPYSINVVVSSCHGVGFEYTVPSNIPEITLIHTTEPIERHFFTKYTNQPDFPISTKFIKISAKDILWVNSNFIGSKQVFWVTENADLQAIDIGIKYSEDDEFKKIDYLWLFGSNSNEYWSQKDPVELANENAIRLIKTCIIKQELEASYNSYKNSNN